MVELLEDLLYDEPFGQEARAGLVSAIEFFLCRERVAAMLASGVTGP